MAQKKKNNSYERMYLVTEDVYQSVIDCLRNNVGYGDGVLHPVVDEISRDDDGAASLAPGAHAPPDGLEVLPDQPDRPGGLEVLPDRPAASSSPSAAVLQIGRAHV